MKLDEALQFKSEYCNKTEGENNTIYFSHILDNIRPNTSLKYFIKINNDFSVSDLHDTENFVVTHSEILQIINGYDNNLSDLVLEKIPTYNYQVIYTLNSFLKFSRVILRITKFSLSEYE